MKTTLIVGAVLAASQCMPEPSDPAGSTTIAERSADAGHSTADVAMEPSSDAGEPGAVATATAKKLLLAGPAPFTVPTRRIQWPQQKATLLAPQGTHIEGDGGRARVILGEGRNFAFHVAPTGVVDLTVPPENATEVARGDAARTWYQDGRWFFSGTFGAFDCWNNPQSEHDRDEVEMMLASCESIEQESPR